MGCGKPLPYINGGVALVAGLLISYFLYLNTGIVTSFASAFPAPLTMNPVAGVVVFGLIMAVIIKLLDAPAAKLGSGQRFRKLKAELAKRPNVTSPGGLAATIGRNKYGKTPFQRLAARGQRRRSR